MTQDSSFQCQFQGTEPVVCLIIHSIVQCTEFLIIFFCNLENKIKNDFIAHIHILNTLYSKIELIHKLLPIQNIFSLVVCNQNLIKYTHTNTRSNGYNVMASHRTVAGCLTRIFYNTRELDDQNLSWNHLNPIHSPFVGTKYMGIV